MASKVENAYNAAQKAVNGRGDQRRNRSLIESQLSLSNTNVNMTGFGNQASFEKSSKMVVDDSLSKYSISHKTKVPVFAAPKQTVHRSPDRIKREIIREVEEQST